MAVCSSSSTKSLLQLDQSDLQTPGNLAGSFFRKLQTMLISSTGSSKPECLTCYKVFHSLDRLKEHQKVPCQKNVNSTSTASRRHKDRQVDSGNVRLSSSPLLFSIADELTQGSSLITHTTEPEEDGTTKRSSYRSRKERALGEEYQDRFKTVRSIILHDSLLWSSNEYASMFASEHNYDLPTTEYHSSRYQIVPIRKHRVANTHSSDKHFQYEEQARHSDCTSSSDSSEDDDSISELERYLQEQQREYDKLQETIQWPHGKRNKVLESIFRQQILETQELRDKHETQRHFNRRREKHWLGRREHRVSNDVSAHRHKHDTQELKTKHERERYLIRQQEFNLERHESKKWRPEKARQKTGEQQPDYSEQLHNLKYDGQELGREYEKLGLAHARKANNSRHKEDLAHPKDLPGDSVDTWSSDWAATPKERSFEPLNINVETNFLTEPSHTSQEGVALFKDRQPSQSSPSIAIKKEAIDKQAGQIGQDRSGSIEAIRLFYSLCRYAVNVSVAAQKECAGASTDENESKGKENETNHASKFITQKKRQPDDFDNASPEQERSDRIAVTLKRRRGPEKSLELACWWYRHDPVRYHACRNYCSRKRDLQSYRRHHFDDHWRWGDVQADGKSYEIWNAAKHAACGKIDVFSTDKSIVKWQQTYKIYWGLNDADETPNPLCDDIVHLHHRPRRPACSRLPYALEKNNQVARPVSAFKSPAVEQGGFNANSISGQAFLEQNPSFFPAVDSESLTDPADVSMFSDSWNNRLTVAAELAEQHPDPGEVKPLIDTYVSRIRELLADSPKAVFLRSTMMILDEFEKSFEQAMAPENHSSNLEPPTCPSLATPVDTPPKMVADSRLGEVYTDNELSCLERADEATTVQNSYTSENLSDSRTSQLSTLQSPRTPSSGFCSAEGWKQGTEPLLDIHEFSQNSKKARVDETLSFLDFDLYD